MNTNQPPVNWTKEREAFEACKKWTYFSSAATTPLRNEVAKGGHDFIEVMKKEADLLWLDLFEHIDELRSRLAKLFGGKADDYGFSPSSSSNMAQLAALIKNKYGLGNIVYVEDEFPTSFVPWRYLGFELKPQKFEFGAIDIDLLLQKVDENTKALVVSSVQFSTGMRVNLKKIGKALKEKKIFFIVNATQSLGVFPLNVEDEFVDAFVCSTHKWLGAGLGLSILYASPQLREGGGWPLAGQMSFDDPEFSGLVSDEKKSTSFIELGVMNYLNYFCLNESLKIIERLGVHNISKRILEITNYLYQALKENKISCASPWDNESNIEKSVRSGIVYIQVPEPKKVEEELRALKVLVNERRGKLRISCHYFNHFEDVDQFIFQLKKVLAGL